MASISKYPISPLDTSLLSYSGSQELFGVSASNVASDISFSLYLQAVIDRLDKAQITALSKANNVTSDTSEANMDSLLADLNAVNNSLKDMLAIRSQMLRAYQNVSLLNF